MKKNIQIIPFRGSFDLLTDLEIDFDNSTKRIGTEKNNSNGQFNIRLIFEIRQNESQINKEIFGDLVTTKKHEQIKLNNKSILKICFGKGLYDEQLDLSFNNDTYSIETKLYKSSPHNNYPAIEALPIPTEIITYLVQFKRGKIKLENLNQSNDMFFDGYSHLGFFLVDLPKMKQVLDKVYKNKNTDLVEEFTTTSIIDTLFEKEIIMLVWGINPYTYPIYSTENKDEIIPFLGNEYSKEGIYNIRENIEELSIIPGHELKNYPNFLAKNWPSIKIFGKGKRTYLKPYQLLDEDSETVITSFLIYRSIEKLSENIPLLNIDLLYSN